MTISNDDEDVKFIKTAPLCPKQRLKRPSKNSLIRNQTDEKNYFSQILPQKKLIQKNKKQIKDNEYI